MMQTFGHPENLTRRGADERILIAVISLLALGLKFDLNKKAKKNKNRISNPGKPPGTSHTVSSSEDGKDHCCRLIAI